MEKENRTVHLKISNRVLQMTEDLKHSNEKKKFNQYLF